MADPARNIDQRRKLVKGKALNPNAAAIMRYRRALEGLVTEMTAIYQREISKFLSKPVAREYFAQDESVAAQARILMTELAKRFDNLFGLKAKGLADDMMRDAASSSAWALKGSLKELSGGLMLKTDILTGELKDVLKASIAENVSLIKSIGETYHKQVEGAVYRAITSAQGGEALVPFLERYKGMTQRRARNIANDQSLKAFASINRARLEKLGIGRYEWLHTAGSQHPRRLHVSYSGRIFSWDSPPLLDRKTGTRAHPGEAIFCRCRAIPVLDFDKDI